MQEPASYMTLEMQISLYSIKASQYTGICQYEGHRDFSSVSSVSRDKLCRIQHFSQ